MKIQIQNLGVVKEATIDLSKKLTVFCGENGTGKTYVSYLLYNLRPMFSDIFIDLFIEKLKPLEELNHHSTDIKLEISIDELEYIISGNLCDKRFRFFDLYDLFAIPRTKKIFKDTKLFTDTKLDKNEFEKDEFSIYDDKYEIYKAKNSSKFYVTIKDFRSLEFINEILNISTMFSRSFFYNSFILPVERNSIFLFSKELSLNRQIKIDLLEKNYKQLNKNISRYTLPVNMLLRFSEDLKHISNQQGEYYKFAEYIENQILNGKINISEHGDIKFNSNRNKRLALDFHMSASIFKNLAGLIIYLKHQAKKNDLIIIDEPELNLHPSNQILLARIFARMIRAGLRLVISTHSDYIIRELNNLIMIGNDNQEVKETAQKKEYGYKPDEYLKADEVGAYLFKFENLKSKDVTVEPITIDSFGFEVKTFDKTIDDLNNTYENIYSALKYGK